MSPVLIACLLLGGLLLFGVPVAFSLAVAGAVGLFMVGGWDSLVGILETTTLSSVSAYRAGRRSRTVHPDGPSS